MEKLSVADSVVPLYQIIAVVLVPAEATVTLTLAEMVELQGHSTNELITKPSSQAQKSIVVAGGVSHGEWGSNTVQLARIFCP